MTVGQRIKQIRKERGMTQENLAKTLVIPAGTVKCWEQDKFKPAFSNIRRLLKVFGMTLEEFAKGVD